MIRPVIILGFSDNYLDKHRGQFVAEFNSNENALYVNIINSSHNDTRYEDTIINPKLEKRKHFGTQALINKNEENKEKQAKRLDEYELQQRIQSSHTELASKKVSTTAYERNSYVAEYARGRANGICQLCNQPAPFCSYDEKPFLEVHHIIWLSRGGEDTINNTVALCPNCHRKMHVLDLAADREKLQTECLSRNNK